MEKEITELLNRILANQVVLYKRLEKVEKKLNGGFRSAPIQTYVQELKKEADEVLKAVNNFSDKI